MVELMPHQQEAVDKLSNGKILWGGVGNGKTLAALSYYTQKDQCGDLYVITTAKKRDLLEWETEAILLGISSDEGSLYGKLTVDSWNNIGKYVDVEGSTFIFDEQRLVGTGAWVKSFLKIAKKNAWIMLSATPGDTWLDYAPVFIANGFYRNITEFKAKHVILSPYSKYPKVERYVQTSELVANKNAILVEMPFVKHTTRHLEYTPVEYDEVFFKETARRRWNPFEDRPCDNYVELFRVLRRITTSHPSRLEKVRELVREHKKVIIFYLHNYELDILRTLSDEVTVAEWNGKKKEPIPETDSWVYLVQYTAGAEGWNCISTNVMIFYALTYSYKHFEQSQGRIDRLNTPYKDLYYYVLLAKSWTDSAIFRSLMEKKDFNERKYVRDHLEK